MRKLSTQILISQAAILAVTVVIGFALFVRGERTRLDHEFEQRAVDVASATAQVPEIRRCLVSGARCGTTVQDIATRIARHAHVLYVVVIDLHRIRHSHPNPRLIGEPVEEPIATLDGRTHVTIDEGSLGRSANGKAPLYGPDGQMVGEISVGIEESSVTAALRDELPYYVLWFGIAAAFSLVASYVLAERLKRRTFGLELDEIAHLLREREAVLHGIREGMIAFDEDARVTMVNDEARRLLGLGRAEIGGRLDTLMPEGRLRDALQGKTQGTDQLVLTDDFVLTVNRMPVTLGGRPLGAVVTLRDRTELSGVRRELDSVRGLTDALRAQQHEFANRMHALAGLLELGRTEEAVRFVSDLRASQGELADSVRSRLASAPIGGLVLAKAAVAAERNVDLRLAEDSWLGDVPRHEDALTTIVGNLLDNAIDAVSEGPTGGQRGLVELSVTEEADALVIRVLDNGPGIQPGAMERIFGDGYSTKATRTPVSRGLGLALVRRTVQRLGGRITASEGPGAVFTVVLPRGVA